MAGQMETARNTRRGRLAPAVLANLVGAAVGLAGAPWAVLGIR